MTELDRSKAEQRLINAYHRVFETAEGKLVLSDLASRFGLVQRVFIPVSKGNHNAYDPLTAALNDGARSVVIHIQDRLLRPVKGDANVETPKTKVEKS